MKTQLILTLYSLLIILLSSCDDKPNPKDDIIIPTAVKGAVWIANEGNFQFGNASLTILDFEKNELYQNVFEKKNGRKLGDVFQSISLINDMAYLVVNNSQKIEVCNPATFVSSATIAGFSSPRFILNINDNKAYVSEYYANAIRIVNLRSNTIIGSIAMTGWGEEMVLNGEKAYITNVNNQYVLVVNTVTDRIEDSILVGVFPSSIKKDIMGNIWVLCKGNPAKNEKPSLHKIDPISQQLARTMVLSNLPGEATELELNSEKNRLYWIAKNIYTLSAIDTTDNVKELVNGQDKNFYGLGVNPVNNELYVSNAKDFVQRSTIMRYGSNGEFKGEFFGGIITSHFFFYYP